MAAGHDAWIDTAEIKATEDWRRRITEGIKASGWVLAFLSRHSVRDPGVCLDEMAIALKEKGGAIATVLLEPSQHVAAPVTLRHIQHFDMQDWAARQQADPAEYEAWYRGKLGEILHLLADPANMRLSGETAELSERLRPISQDADIGPLIEGFVGREWLLDQLEAWRTSDTGARLFWLTGPPGSGKSAFSARTAHWGKANVISLSLCRYNIDDRRDAARIVRTLAFQLATRLPDYRLLLLALLRRHDPEGTEVLRQSASGLFDWLLVQPLHSGIDGGRSGDRLVVVIDALDETVRDGRSELVELLAEAAPRLPGWIGVLVTSRPDSPVVRQLGHIQPHPITTPADNRADLEVYAQGWLGGWLGGTGRPAAEVQALVRRVCAAADGNFLYLRKLREAVEAGQLSLDAAEALPRGLVGLYERWFRHLFPDVASYEREVLPALEVIVAAEHPVPLEVLTRLFGWPVRARARLVARLAGLFEVRGEAIAPFHKSVRDWLLDEHTAGADFVADAAAGRARLLGLLWPEFLASADRRNAALPGAFPLAELPRLLAMREAEAPVATWAGAPGWEAALDRGIDIAQALAARFDWPRARAWWQTVDALAQAVGDPGLPYRRFVLVEQGDLERTIGDSKAAMRAYKESLAVAQRLAAQDLNNALCQRDLSVSHERIGDVLRAQGDGAGTLASYRASLMIRERLAMQDPGNAEWQRDLSVSHDRIGNVLRAQGDGAGALASYRASLMIRERLAMQDPGNAEWQRDLSVSHNKIGDVLGAQGDGAGALASFRASLAIRERLAAQDPDNAGWQRDLSVSHERIGDVLRAQGDGAGALASYRASLMIRERLAMQDPGNAEWQRDLSVSHERIGDVLRAQGDGAGALAAYRASLAISERLAMQDPGNAEWQRDLSISHFKLARLLTATDLPAARTHALQAQAQARLWAERFPQSADKQAILDAVADLVRQTGAAP